MKKLEKIVITVFIALSMNSFSQLGTTIEEYNYVTKGYQAQLDMGLDMKKGYELVEWKSGYNQEFGLVWDTEYGPVERNITFYLLVKQECEHPIRAIMVKYNFSDFEETFDNYLCIPNDLADGEIWDMFRADYEGYSEELWNALVWALANSKALEVQYP